MKPKSWRPAPPEALWAGVVLTLFGMGLLIAYYATEIGPLGGAGIVAMLGGAWLARPMRR